MLCPELLTPVSQDRTSRQYSMHRKLLGMFKTEQPTQTGPITVLL
jgi:hypothetical protein